MRTHYTIALAMLTGVAIGAVAIHGLHAQAKPKAYTITELEVLDAAAMTTYVPAVQAAQKAAGGIPYRTGGGKIVSMEGAAAPKRVAITEWNSLDQAEAFFNSAAWKDLKAQRDKATKIIRRYAVEAMN